MSSRKSFFTNFPDIVPVNLSRSMGIAEVVEAMGRTCFEARNVSRGARLFSRMVSENDVIWLGISGAGVAGGMGGIITTLINSGFIDVICSTGAQVYHDLHFAFGLPVKAINPVCDDDSLRKDGDTRIYDIGIREKETLEAQDEIIRRFIMESHKDLYKGPISSWQFNMKLGNWVLENAPFPERSFVAAAANRNIPLFWDSLANHSIAMNMVKTDLMGFPLVLSAQKDILDSAAIAYSSAGTGFLELGGGGPKNFIQQTGPTISQILGIDFDGADRGLQIGTAAEREGSLSGCTFGEAVTWGKYRSTGEDRLVQIWGEYSVVFPLIAAYALEKCEDRKHRGLAATLPEISERFVRDL